MGLRKSEDGRPLPIPTPLAAPFFEAAAEGRLLIPHCPRDGWFFYPRSRCPTCLGDDWDWREASGQGEVHAFTVDRVGHDPALAADNPYAVAVVELAEGPRMPARIVGGGVDDVRVGMPVEAHYEDIEGITLVRFAPREN